MYKLILIVLALLINGAPMKYKILMENWRKFLNEQPRPDALDHGFGAERAAQIRRDAEKQKDFEDALIDLELDRYEREDAEKEKEREGKFGDEKEENEDVDRTFPVYKNSTGEEKNFINPFEGGLVSGRFDQTRNKCRPPKGSDIEPKQIYHNAIDVYNTKGSPFLAVADGVVTNVVSEETGYNEGVAKLAKSLIKVAKRITDPRKSTVEETIEELQKVKVWDDIRNIQANNLRRRAIEKHIRGTGVMGTGGMSVTIKTNADQRGRQWFIYGSHLDSVDVSIGQAITAGQTLGTCGGTTIAESKPHLHLEVWLDSKSDVSDLPPADIRKKIWRNCAERSGTSIAARPKKIFPKLKGAKKKQGIYQNN